MERNRVSGTILARWQRFGQETRFLVQFMSYLIMRISYNPEADILKVVFQESAVEKSDRSQPDRILDYDKHGNLVAIAILNAQERVANPQIVE